MKILEHPMLVIGMILTMVGLAIYSQGGGHLLYGEADWFLIDHNTDQRSYLSKVICPHLHDAQNYLARELAHVVENIDARFVHWCVMAGWPHFLSISNYVMMTAIAFLLWLAARCSGFPALTSLLISMLFLAAPPVFMSGAYIRSGHMLATFLMVVLILFLYWQWHTETPWRYNAMAATTFALSFLLIWSDRQGLFALLSIGLMVLLLRPKGWQMVFVPMAAATLVQLFHFLVTGPWLVAKFTPFADVVMSGNLMKVSGADKGNGALMAIVSNVQHHWMGAVTIALSNWRYLLGGISYVVAGATLVAESLMLGRRWWLIILPVCLIVLMNCIMLGASDVLLWPDCLPNIYYHIISTTALVMVSGFALLHCRGQRWVDIVLGLALLGSIASLPGHIKTFRQGHLGGFVMGADFLRKELKATVARPPLPKEGKPVYDALESCRFVDWKWVMKNPMEYGGKLTANEFVESSQYLQFVRSELGQPFGRGGR